MPAHALVHSAKTSVVWVAHQHGAVLRFTAAMFIMRMEACVLETLDRDDGLVVSAGASILSLLHPWPCV